MKNLKRLAAATMALAMVLGLTACGGGGESETADGLEGKEISIMTPYLSSVTTNQMVEYLQSGLEEKGAEVTVIDTANDFSALASRIEDVVTAQTDGIILVSADPTQLENQLQEAFDAGIPVFGCDSGYIEGMETNATSDNYQMGEMITEYLSHNHHFKWWFGLALIRADYMRAQKGGYRKRCHWSAYKAVLLESSFLDSSACSLIYFFIASSVILPIVET